MNRFPAYLFLTLLAVVLSGCMGQQHHTKSSVMDYLYPKEDTANVTASIPHLKLPLRVGIAFVPSSTASRSGATTFSETSSMSNAIGLTENKKMLIMDKVASHFRDLEFVKDIEVIPSAYLKRAGGFANLDQIKTMYDIDVIALISHDQSQFVDNDVSSLSYWTIIGAYVVSGEKNDTSTMVDTVVFDVASRKMLFRAPGLSQIQGTATPVNLSVKLREDSVKGFDDASDDMIDNLKLQLERFQNKVKERPEEFKISHNKGYSGGGGSLGLLALGALFSMVGCLSLVRNRVS